ncbi:PRTRC system protein B [Cupriavidus basilensis]|uniref:PRTRC system protein B n=1 Tax=Cupriavidus basilensis TaxID=68895 RepID=UPI0039F6CD17
MTTISMTQAGVDINLTKAVLLYSQKDGTIAYGTIHPVLAAPKGDRPTIGAGVPIDRFGLVQCLQSLAENAMPGAEFLPATVLSVGPHAVTWWCPPCMRRVFFESKELGNRSSVVPHPGLVFQAAVDGFRVFALRDECRPTPKTKLYEPPYFNTWDAGKICIGTANVPAKIDVNSIKGWEDAFFNSAFTHPNHGGKRVAYKRGLFAFWKDMLDGTFGKEFPKDALVPFKHSLSDLIAGVL